MVRSNRNLAASTRMFTGEEQRQLERQITPLTPEWRRARVALAERTLKDLTAITGRGGLTASQQIYPAWRRALGAVEPLAGKATDDAGLWRFEMGAEVYADSLRRYTTTNLTADEIHQIGLNEVARIEKEMDAILASSVAPRDQSRSAWLS